MSSKQREALSEILELIDKWRTDGVMEHWQYSQLFDVADNALSEPLKNWEVGTPEEQAERFKRYCPSGDCKRYVCNSYGYEKLFHHKCFPIWGQLPYESEVKNG